MSVNAINTLLQQIHLQARQASGTGNPDATERATPFSTLLSDAVAELNQTQTRAQRQAEAYMRGAPGVALNDVMVSLQKSTLALNFGIQLRNKLVSAYQDIMNMSV